MKKCRVCRDGYGEADILPDGSCRWCAEKESFAAFAKSCGLTRYPDPTGERYVYAVDGGPARKKGECVNFMDELWDALVRAKGGSSDLLLKRE